MKMNFLKISGALIIFATLTGCLEKKSDEAAASTAAVDPRVPLVDAIDNQATKLIVGINEVIVSGSFVQNLLADNPPQPLSLENEQDVLKAVDYLLSNQTQLGEAISYSPDSRLCTELIAKENSNVCVQVMNGVTLVQIPTSSTEGVLEFNFASAKPFVLSYSSTEVSVAISLIEITKALAGLKQIQVQNGEEPFLNSAPYINEGSLLITVSNQLNSSFINLSITSAIDLQGADNFGRYYSVQSPATESIVALTLNPVSGLANLVTNISNINALFYAKDEQDQDHQVSLYFPGLSGSFALDNSISTLVLQALKLASSYLFITIDGEQGVYLTLNEINAQLQSSAGGNFILTAVEELSGQLLIATNPLISEQGGIYVYANANTQLSYSHTFDQGKILQGSLMYLGSLDFSSNINAYANTCLEGVQNSHVLTTAICKF